MSVNQVADIPTVKGTNFCAVKAGPFAQLNTYKLEVPHLSRTVSGKLFIKQFLGLSGMQLSLNNLPPGAGVPFSHQHRENEEAYIFVRGRGQMQVDGETFDVEEGSVVRVSTKGNRTLRNNSQEELCFICVQAKEGSLNRETFEDGIRSESPVVWP